MHGIQSISLVEKVRPCILLASVFSLAHVDSSDLLIHSFIPLHPFRPISLPTQNTGDPKNSPPKSFQYGSSLHRRYQWITLPYQSTDTCTAPVLSVWNPFIRPSCSRRDLSGFPRGHDDWRPELHQGQFKILRLSRRRRRWSDYDPSAPHSWKDSLPASPSDGSQVGSL